MKNQAGITVIPTDKMTPVSGAGQSRGRGDIAGRPVTNMQTLSDSDPKAGGAKLVPSNQSAAHETAVQHNQIDGKKQNIHANNAGATVSGIVNNKKDVHQNGTTTITPSKGARGDVPVVSPPPAMAGSAGPGRANTPPSGAQKGASGQIINSGDMGKGTSHQGGKNTVPAPGVQGGAIVPQNQNRQHHAVNSIRQDGPPLVNRPAGNTGLTGNAPSSGKNMGNNHGQQSGSRQNRPQSGQYPRGGSAPTPSEPGGQQGRSGASPVKSANNNRNIRPVDPNKGKKNGGGKS